MKMKPMKNKIDAKLQLMLTTCAICAGTALVMAGIMTIILMIPCFFFYSNHGVETQLYS